jgi:hypothetical protein
MGMRLGNLEIADGQIETFCGKWRVGELSIFGSQRIRKMFTHSDIQAARSRKTEPEATARLNVIEYNPQDVWDGRGEDWIQIFSAPRTAFSSDLEFWLAIMEREFVETEPDGRWLDKYLSSGWMQNISSNLYEREIRRLTHDLRPPPSEELLFRGQPRDVLTIWLNYCDEAVLATFDDRYVAVRWNSTA